MTSVGTCPSGIAAAGLAGRPSPRFRDAFLGTVAAGALSLVSGAPALAALPAGCTIDGTGTIETCIGNQSAGVTAAPAPVTTLNVNSLTTAITPASGTAGIKFTSAGAVTITSDTGAFGITTAGNAGFGIFARSLGSGPVTVTSTGNITTAGVSGVGIVAYGNGGGAVTVTSTGNITTTGIGSGLGILAFDLAGGTTVTSTGNITTAGSNSTAISARASGAVTATSTGNIATAGSNSYGIFAQSGTGSVTVTSTGNITTAGAGAFGIDAGSFGAGAIAVTSTGNIATAGVGASGIYLNGGPGSGAVTLTSTGNITTAGNAAFGINAYSQGAGAIAVISTGNIATKGIRSDGIRVDTSGAGAVMVTSTGNITTAGNTAYGINAKGRGAVTVNSTGNIATAGSSAHGISADGIGAGAVTVTSTGNIATAGTGAQGIFAVGNGTGAVTVTSIGNIAVAGSSAFGIVVEKFGAGAVTVTSSGNITASGSSNSNGIAGGSTGGPINIIVNSGTVSGGSGLSAGVVFSGGTNNTLTNRGTLTALSGIAILGEAFNGAPGGNNTVNNFGNVTGSVILDSTTVVGNMILGGGGGANAFNNMAGGVFNSGATVSLGPGNTLTNAGALLPGGAGVIQTTALSGNLVQTTTGIFLTDINIAGATSDRINVSGTAKLAGAVQLQVSNLTFAPWQQTILSAAGGTTTNGLALLASPALQAQLVYPNATDVVVKSTGLNFVVPGLNNNQTSLANALNGAAQTAGFGGPVFNLLLNGVTSVAGYNAVLNQLTGEAATGTQQTTIDAMNLFIGTMTDPFNRGTASTPGGGASGYASEAYASTQNAGTARDAYAMFTKAPLAQTYDPRWSVWASGFGGSQTTDGNATVGSNTSTSSVYGTRWARTIYCRRVPSWVLHWPAAARTSTSLDREVDTPICSRPAHLFVTPLDRPTSRQHWPMAGRRSPPTAP
jgi:hypothetical protein